MDVVVKTKNKNQLLKLEWWLGQPFISNCLIEPIDLNVYNVYFLSHHESVVHDIFLEPFLV